MTTQSRFKRQNRVIYALHRSKTRYTCALLFFSQRRRWSFHYRCFTRYESTSSKCWV